MTRQEFVALACAQAMHGVENEGQRRHHVVALVATAEATADALGMPARLDPGAGDAQDELRAARERIADLESQVEALTAPPKATGPRGSR